MTGFLFLVETPAMPSMATSPAIRRLDMLADAAAIAPMASAGIFMLEIMVVVSCFYCA